MAPFPTPMRRGAHRLFARPAVMATLAALALTWSMSPTTARAQDDAAPACQPVGPAYLGEHDPARTSVVVFVHGVLSSASGAWSRDKQHAWPCMLRNDPRFDNSNIYLYEYDTHALGSSPSLDEVATQMRKDLHTEKVLQHAHVTLIAHSMGGLVVARMLLQMHADPAQAQSLSRIKLVQFYGTPATGSDMANVASRLSGSVQFQSMRKDAETPLIKDWAAATWPFPWYCFAEGRRTGPFWPFSTMVVPRDSALALCRTQPRRTDVMEGFDHLTIVKPVSLQDTPHRHFLRSFVSCVPAAVPRHVPPSEVDTPDGQAVLSTLNQLRAGLSDLSDAGRVAWLSVVERTLHVSAAGGDAYFLPTTLAQPALLSNAFDHLGSRPFSLEFIKLFQPRPASLSPAWVGRVAKLTQYVPDGQLIELRQAWIDAGRLLPSDMVVALEPRATGEQVLIVTRMGLTSGGDKVAGLRGILIVPPPPSICD